MTDSEGRFEFQDLSAGHFTLTVSKTGYVTLQYGQRRPLEPGKTIELSDGQTLDANFALPRGSAITGRIFDEHGEPVPDATVQAMRYQYGGGQRQLVPAGRAAQTDDIGQFRVFGLMPGDYYISASLRTSGLPVIEGFVLGGASQGGGGGFPRAITDELRVFAGPLSDESTGYAPTYYPGTPTLAEAQRINVGVGEEVPGISFALTAARLSRISGTVVDSSGTPLARAQVMLRPSGGAGFVTGRISFSPDGHAIAFASGGNASAPVTDGTFTVSGVTPGSYVLQVRAPRTRDEAEFASMPVVVSGSDIQGLVIATAKGATVTGRVIFGRDSKPASDWPILVSAVSTEPETSPIGAGTQDGVEAGGTFELRGLGGPTLFRLDNTPNGWALKAVRLGGADITDTPHAFKGGETIDGLEIELTNRLTRIDGTVIDTRGQPVSQCAVVIFADDRERWGFLTRFVRSARSAEDGRFQIGGLPPGQYLAVALDYLEQGSESDPDLLERLRLNATSLTLDEGETQQLNLKLSQ